MQRPPLETCVAFLQRVPLFSGIDDKLLGILAQIMTLSLEPEGTLLCEEGAPGDSCFVIGHGRVEIFTGPAIKREVLCELGAGAVVGEVALIDGKKRSASLLCLQPTSVFTLKREDFERLLHAGNRASQCLLENITRALAERVRVVNGRYGEIFSRSGETIARLSAELRSLQGAAEGAGQMAISEDEASDAFLALVAYTQAPTGG